MSRYPGSRQGRRIRFPRVSGDEPYADDTVYELAEFSPRERG